MSSTFYQNIEDELIDLGKPLYFFEGNTIKEK